MAEIELFEWGGGKRSEFSESVVRSILLEDLTETITLISAEIIRKFDFNVTLSSNN